MVNLELLRAGVNDLLAQLIVLSVDLSQVLLVFFDLLATSEANFGDALAHLA